MEVAALRREREENTSKLERMIKLYEESLNTLTVLEAATQKLEQRLEEVNAVAVDARTMEAERSEIVGHELINFQQEREQLLEDIHRLRFFWETPPSPLLPLLTYARTQ